MRRIKVGVLDLVTKNPAQTFYAKVMHANLAGIMSQVVATWCEEEGCEVDFFCYMGMEKLPEDLPEGLDLVFISAFTQTALLAYSLSNFFRSRGTVTALGGPHARCYPEDARNYFDYVLGLTNRQIVRDVVRDCSPYRPHGIHLSADLQPESLPGVRERWKFISSTLAKAPFIKIVPMIGSLGCPYTCSFCVDSAVPYQTLSFEEMKKDLQFLLKVMKRPHVGWHDPNFGVRFDDCMEAIESVVPPGRMDFIAESTLSILSEPHLKRMQRNGFKALLPGIESWFDLGNKSKTRSSTGMDKVKQVSEHLNMLSRYIPYLQTNFVLGLDADRGPEPFELTKRFLDMTPGAFPAYSLLSAFGRAAPLNLEYQRADRVLPFPFHFLDNNKAMNVRPKNYSWPEFYDNLIGLYRHSFSWRRIFNRYRANRGFVPRWMNVVRAVSSEGFGRLKYHLEIRERLETDSGFLAYFNQETTVLPDFYLKRIEEDLGDMWDWLPEGAIHHDANAYQKSERKVPSEQPSERVETVAGLHR